MSACANCSRALQPAWKYCIFCGTRTGVVATAPRSRPLPKRMPVPGFASAVTAQSPIVPLEAPAPLAAAPTEAPVSSIWPETMGERPTLRAALVGTEIPAPTPPREEAPAPEGEDAPEGVAEVEGEADAPTAAGTDIEPTDAVAPEASDEPAESAEPEAEPDPQPEPEPQTEPRPELKAPRRSRRASAPAGTLVAEPEPETDTEIDHDPDDESETRAGSVNSLAILALLIGVLACPLAALFGHLALGQVRASGERGVIPAWIAIVLGYLWLGFWIVFGITYLATNG